MIFLLKIYVCLSTLFCLFFKVESQISIPVFGKQNVLSGFSRPLSGESIPYFSVYPDYVKDALLTRCTVGNKSIEWETSELPVNNKEPYLYLSWIAAHSTGTNTGI